MNKCNNCAKFLTCDRKECDQVTFLQAGQLERIKYSRNFFKINPNSLAESMEQFRKAICEFGMITKEALEEDKKKFIEALKKEGNK